MASRLNVLPVHWSSVNTLLVLLVQLTMLAAQGLSLRWPAILSRSDVAIICLCRLPLTPDRVPFRTSGLATRIATEMGKHLGVDSPFFSTIVLFNTQPFFLEFRRFARKKDPWKEWRRYP